MVMGVDAIARPNNQTLAVAHRIATVTLDVSRKAEGEVGRAF